MVRSWTYFIDLLLGYTASLFLPFASLNVKGEAASLNVKGEAAPCCTGGSRDVDATLCLPGALCIALFAVWLQLWLGQVSLCVHCSGEQLLLEHRRGHHMHSPPSTAQRYLALLQQI
jgi:hypothetical protein